MSDYRDALVAAGANVISFATFGDWQGKWVALVTYLGNHGWVQGSFGSCDHCDAFQAEFGWSHLDDEGSLEYNKRLAAFGQTYLDTLQTTEEIAADFDRYADWDEESEQAAAWVRATAEHHGVKQ